MYEELSRLELEAKVWANIVTRIVVKALLQPSIFRLLEDAYDENMKPMDTTKKRINYPLYFENG